MRISLLVLFTVVMFNGKAQQKKQIALLLDRGNEISEFSPDSALQIFEQALELATGIDTIHLPSIYNRFAQAYSMKGDYTTDAIVREKIADEMSLAATPVSFNLIGGIYMNQNAAFSDFHVTGGNPSGNASFTNPEYVTKRFTWEGHREPVK
jgi:hypothetical protein